MCLALAVTVFDAGAQGMGDVLNAPRVKDVIRLHEVPDGKKSVIRVVVDDPKGTFHPLAADRTFLTSGTIGITVYRFNPLRTAVKVTVDDVPDPTAGILEKLGDGVSGFAGVVGPGIGTFAALMAKAPNDCTAILPALLTALDAPEWHAGTIKKHYDNWSDQIEENLAGGGFHAVQNALTSLNTELGKLRESLASIDKGIEKLDGCGGLDVSGPIVRPRRDHAALVVAGVEEIRKLLVSYQGLWHDGAPADLIIKTGVEPTGKQMRKVTVAFTRISYSAPVPSGLVLTKKEDVGGASFMVRRYSAWRPEIGVGLIYSNPKRPKYGTGKNEAGETIIAAAKTDSSSLDPSVLVNFVCGFCGATPLVPMFQIGASTSKTSPALFFGGGIRLLSTGKGDFAIGSGLVVPWAKQLKSGVEPGTVIDGTAALENQLEWRRVTGKHVYFSIQYKF